MTNNTQLLYNITLKYESELFVSNLDESFEDLHISLTGRPSGFGSLYTISHDVKIANAPVVPTDEEIEKMRNTLFEALKESLSNKSNIELKNTKFIGITSIKPATKEEKENETLGR